MRHILCALLICLAALNADCLVYAGQPDDPLTFEGSVRLVFKTHCFHCHGEAGVTEGGLDLRLRRLMVEGGDSGAAIEPGDDHASYLLQRMIDGDMPPEEVAIRPTQAEVDLVRRWIESGAKTARPEPEDPAQLPRITPEERQHWAFQPIRKTEPPAFAAEHQIRTPIDAFVLRKLHEQKKSFSENAARRTLIRRATFDLTGLPPTPAQVDAFLQDESETAYETLIDQLLASPAYGQRWARHWLDIAGYADSEGASESDPTRPYAYKYRDYVIHSLNQNKPIDRFIIEQLAGDELVESTEPSELSDEDQQLLIATGFLRTAPDGTGASPDDPDTAKNAVVAETIKIVSTSLMGMTVGCAQCHDHRFDPILHDDYYRIRAVFEPALNWKKWKSPNQRRIPLASTADQKLVADVEKRAAEATAKFKAAEDAARQLVFGRELKKIPEEHRQLAIDGFPVAQKERTEAQKQLFVDYPNLDVGRGSALDLYLDLFDEGAKRKKELAELKSKIGKIRSELPQTDYIRGITEDGKGLPKTFIFHRGDHSQPTEEVPPGSLTVLDHLLPVDFPANNPDRPSSGRRLAFAKHLVSDQNPLTARVLVNRFWLHHMGRGLVSTPGDFGIQGQPPSHPQLLDWLAGDFIAHGWDLKRLHRQIMTSTVYRQSSYRSDPNFDPENVYYSRQSVRRLEAETIRDSILLVSGQLATDGDGKAEPVNTTDTGETIVDSDVDLARKSRRSVYVQSRRSKPLAIFEAFDAPSLEPNCTLRTVSTVTPQSLLMMNSEVLVKQSTAFAKRLQSEAGPNVKAQIRTAWEIAYSSPPTDQQIASSVKFLQRQRDFFRSRDGDGRKGESKKEGSEQTQPEFQALTSFCQVILDSNQFLYVD